MRDGVGDGYRLRDGVNGGRLMEGRGGFLIEFMINQVHLFKISFRFHFFCFSIRLTESKRMYLTESKEGIDKTFLSTFY